MSLASGMAEGSQAWPGWVRRGGQRGEHGQGAGRTWEQSREELVGVLRGRQRSPWVRLDMGGAWPLGAWSDVAGGPAGRGGREGWGLAPGSSLLCYRHLTDGKKNQERKEGLVLN